MKKQGQIIIGFVVVFIIVLFSVLNVDKVPLNLGFTKINAPLILIILISSFLGAILIFVNSFATILKKNKEIKTLNQNIEEKLAEKVQEVDEKWQDKFNNYTFEMEEKLRQASKETVPLVPEETKEVPAPQEN